MISKDKSGSGGNLVGGQQKSDFSKRSKSQIKIDDAVVQQFQSNPLISKVLMFKTNNEESNAKVAALRSIIKLSQNSNPSYIPSKQTTTRADSKDQNNQSSTGQQPNTNGNGVQYKQIS